MEPLDTIDTGVSKPSNTQKKWILGLATMGCITLAILVSGVFFAFRTTALGTKRTVRLYRNLAFIRVRLSRN